jgi:hypothetical protein
VAVAPERPWSVAAAFMSPDLAARRRAWMVSGLHVGERMGSAFPVDVASPSEVIELSSCSPRLVEEAGRSN